MPLLHAIVLGITQGLSEFLPISSSGHLLLVPWLFGWDDFSANPELERTFDVALHLGTLVGAVAYFRSDLLRLSRAGLGALRPRSRLVAAGGGAGVATETGVPPVPADLPADPAAEARLAWLLLASAVPAAIIGALFESTFDSIARAEWAIGTLLVVFGLVLLWADRMGGTRTADHFGVRDALFMGMAQACALAPGVSRSGVTITAGRRLGFSRDGAARLAFLMSLPITAGALLYEGLDVVRDPSLLDGLAGAFVAGVLASAVTGWVAVWGTLRLIRARTFSPFVVYRVIVGTGVVVLAASSLR